MKKINFKSDVKGNLKKAVSLILMTTVGTVSVFSLGNLSKKVNVDVDGEKRTTLTLNNDTNKILSQLGVETTENDKVTRHDEDNEINIDVKKSFTVHVHKGGSVTDVEMVEGTVEDALNKAGITLSENEGINGKLEDEVFAGMNIAISPLVMIKVNMGGETKECFAPQGSVIGALRYLDIDISSEDILNVDALSLIYEGMEIKINKVEYQEETVEEYIPFKTIYQKSDLINDNSKKIVSAGKKGINRVTYKKVLIDGKEVKKEVINSELICNPVDEVIVTNHNYHEPKPAPEPKQSVATNNDSGSSKGGRVLTGYATAYTASAGSRTSTGARPVEGVTVAVNPKLIPYGKTVVVRNKNSGKVIYKGKAQDTGGALMSNRTLVDVYMDSRSDCINFGRQAVEVTVED